MSQPLSTASIARKHNICQHGLLSFLINNGYLYKNGKYNRLTDKGFGIGGIYFENSQGESWPVWPEESIVSLINRVAWPVGIIGTFQEMRKKAYRRFEENECDKDILHQQLEQGTKILGSQVELDAYIRWYGSMHEAKLTLAYEALHRSENLERLTSGKIVQIVDYACGQGVASILFKEFLNKVNKGHYLGKAIFIEPSKLALDACASKFTGNIIKVNKKLDELTESDISTTESCQKFHFFSNILDMADVHFDANILARKIASSQKGINYFVCVSPRNKAKLDDFMHCFTEHVLISEYSGEIPNPSQYAGKNPWKVVWNIFKVELQ